jgi:hypothetical protein
MRIVNCIENDNWLGKTVILFEDEKYLIKMPFNSIMNNDRDNRWLFLRMARKMEDRNITFSTFLEEIKSLEKAEGVLSLHSFPFFMENGDDDDWLTYLLAHCLEKGICYIYDKDRKSNIRQIKFRKWAGGNSAELYGAGGREFYICDDILFLKTQDWVS